MDFFFLVILLSSRFVYFEELATVNKRKLWIRRGKGRHHQHSFPRIHNENGVVLIFCLFCIFSVLDSPVVAFGLNRQGRWDLSD